MWKWQHWRPALLGLLMVAVAAGGLGIGYLAQRSRLAARQPQVPVAQDPVQAATGREADWPGGVPVITAATQLVIRTTYLRSDETVEATEKPGESIVGLSLEALRRFHPEWTVLDFSPERVVVRAIKDAWAPGQDPAEMERYRTIGIKDGKVTIFWGKAGPNLPVKEITTFGADSLSPEGRAMLEPGYTVDGDEAVAQYLEGLAE